MGLTSHTNKQKNKTQTDTPHIAHVVYSGTEDDETERQHDLFELAWLSFRIQQAVKLDTLLLCDRKRLELSS